MMQREVVEEVYSSGFVVPFPLCSSGNRLTTVSTEDELILCPVYILPVFTTKGLRWPQNPLFGFALIYLLFFSLCAFSGDLSPPLHLHGTFHVI
jgi:hypothetical protein